MSSTGRTRPRTLTTPSMTAGALGSGVILHVDGATHLALLDEDSIQPSPTLGPSATYVAGVAKLEDGMVLIHDLTTFLSDAEAASLDEALRAPGPR